MFLNWEILYIFKISTSRNLRDLETRTWISSSKQRLVPRVTTSFKWGMGLPGCSGLHLFLLPRAPGPLQLMWPALPLQICKLCTRCLITSRSQTTVLLSVLDFRDLHRLLAARPPVQNSSIYTEVSWQPSLLTLESKSGPRLGSGVVCLDDHRHSQAPLGPLRHTSPRESGT